MLLALLSSYDSLRLDEYFLMGLFAGIIFAEKIWSKGIYVSKATGIVFMIIGILTMIGTVSIMPEDENMGSLHKWRGWI
ncbi:MAG: hypothetical protein P0116_03005 [Candidatus Nitrosocosmicus sp.]|nr:hypothetical protein [Candidatus Nitrosocosmicus sp.]